MGVDVVELSSDSEAESIGKVPIVRNGSASHAGDRKTKSSPKVSKVRAPRVEGKTKSSPKVSKVTAPRVERPRLCDPLPIDQVRRFVNDGDLKKLRVADLQSYARDECLIVGGTKQVLFDRIKRHIEFLEHGVCKYDSKSFTIDCTGDVCAGDVVRFRQRVYHKNIPYQHHPPLAGMRTVSGLVVKESYGEKRQQHTFTIEVLWSFGYQRLAPMEQLKIKGRNLYKFRVSRQAWEDEDMRLTVLQEKHDRGDAAKRACRLRKPYSGNPRASGLLGVALGGLNKRKRPELCEGSGSALASAAVKSKKAKQTPHSLAVCLDRLRVKHAKEKQNLNQARNDRLKQTIQPSRGKLSTKSDWKLKEEMRRREKKRREFLASYKSERKLMPAKKMQRKQYNLRSTRTKG